MGRIPVRALPEKVREALPAPLRSIFGRTYQVLYCAYRAFGAVADLAWRHATGRTHLPPLRLRELIGRGDYAFIGEAFLRHFRELCDLQAEERVLEIGCGAGRMAWPLARYLNARGRYVGTEVCADAVR